MLDHFHILAPFYDRLMGPPDAARLAGLLQLPSSGWLLDGGGGTGRVSNPLGRMVGRVVVADICSAMLVKARAKGLDAVRGRVEQLPFANDSFDRILVVDALHHFADPSAAIRDLARVLKPGGRMVLEEFDAGRMVVRVIAIAERIALMRSRFFRPQDIREMMRAHGLRAEVQDRRRLAVWVVGEKL